MTKVMYLLIYSSNCVSVPWVCYVCMRFTISFHWSSRRWWILLPWYLPKPTPDDVLLRSNDGYFAYANCLLRIFTMFTCRIFQTRPQQKKKEGIVCWKNLWFLCILDCKSVCGNASTPKWVNFNIRLAQNNYVFLFQIGKVECPVCTFCHSSEETVF